MSNLPIATAEVLVEPNTAAFAATLRAELEAAVRAAGPISIPVVAAPASGAATAAAAALAQQTAATKTAAVAQRELGAEVTKTAAAQAVQSNSIARSEAALRSLGLAERAVEAGERRAALTATEVAAARTRLAAADRAVQRLETGLATAAQKRLIVEDQLIRSALEVAVARREEATATLQSALADAEKAARATAASAAADKAAASSQRRASAAAAEARANQAQALRGAGATALAAAGARGATLAAGGPFLAGAALAVGLGKSIQLAGEFESQMSVLGVTTQATSIELERAGEAARRFGSDITLPGVTAGDAAQTITEFAKAGLSLNDSIAATRGGLQLAQAAQLEYADAVELTANALNAFNLQGTQAGHVADVLANAANLSQGGIDDMALALRQAAGAAAVVGVSFEDTSALLTLLARNGLTGSDAGTALRTAFLRLVNPTDEAKQVLQDLNVQLRDASGNVRPEVFAEFAAAQRELSTATQQANAAIVFGQDAFRAFGFLGREGTDGLDEIRVGLDRTGTAAELAAARMTGLRGATENLSNQLSTFGQSIGEVALPPLTLFVNEMASFVSAGNEAIGVAKGITEAFADIVPPAPPGSGFLFDIGQEIFKTGNPIGQAMRVRDFLRNEQDETEEQIRNGGVELRGAIEDAGREGVRGARTFQSEIVGAFQVGFEGINAAIRAGAAKTRASAIAAATRGQGRQAGLEEIFNQIVAGGGDEQQQIANLRRQAATQAEIIEKAGPDAAGVLLEARRRAQAKLASINGQIASIERGISAEADRARREREQIQKEAAEEADRAVLQRQQLARQSQENQITRAEDTPGLADDIRRTEQLRALINRQIEQVRSQVRDERTKQAAVQSLLQTRFETTRQLRELRRQSQEHAEERRKEAADALRDSLSTITQIAEARGNDQAVLVALNAEIANQRRRVAAAKKAKDGVLDETLALEQLLQARRDLIERVEDGAEEVKQQGTTAFDLLRSAAETFASTGGNLIGGSQPFAGATGFTADIAQFLRRQRANTSIANIDTSDVFGRAAARGGPGGRSTAETEAVRAIRDLIEALRENTNSKGGNSSTAGGNDFEKVTAARAEAMGKYWQSRQSRRVTEGRSGI